MTAMTDMDRLGRRRAPAQNRGLRPLFPKLPADVVTRSLRIAMSAPAWQQLETLADVAVAPTRPRAIGAVVERALEQLDGDRPTLASDWSSDLVRPALHADTERPVDWLAWQAAKEQRLIGLH